MPRLACDVGGTFTDLVVDRGGNQTAYKAPTTPDDPVAGVLDAIGLAAADAGHDRATFLARAYSLSHATTLAINAVLTGRTARTALLTTQGHRDILLLREGRGGGGAHRRAVGGGGGGRRVPAVVGRQPGARIARRRNPGPAAAGAGGHAVAPAEPGRARVSPRQFGVHRRLAEAARGALSGRAGDAAAAGGVCRPVAGGDQPGRRPRSGSAPHSRRRRAHADTPRCGRDHDPVKFRHIADRRHAVMG